MAHWPWERILELAGAVLATVVAWIHGNNVGKNGRR